MDLTTYRQRFFADPAPAPRFAYHGVHGVTLYFADYDAAVAYYTRVLGPPAYVEGDGTRGWPLGDTWLTLLKGGDGAPRNVEVAIVMASAAEAERLQAAFIAAGGTGDAPRDDLMYEPVRLCPARDPFGTDVLVYSRTARSVRGAGTARRPRRGVLRRAGFALLTALSLAIAGYAVWAYGFRPIGALVDPQMRATFEAHRIGLYAHVFGAVFALALGPAQFSSWLHGRYLAVHRWTGRLYLGLGVLVGGSAGLYMAFHAFGGPVARAGFACLAVAWLASGLLAYRAIRGGDEPAHRRWMIRNFSLTFAAVTLRLWLPAAMAAGVPFATAYPVIAWLCWAPNVAVAEALWNRGVWRAA
ncbi:MAG: DUF2306 domain-containing protein [Ardenticatenales bacterium]|nr:DUF2306 domain-containing protein [Ardenticatenales bacterium]